MKISRNRIKEIVRETIVEENAYQEFFQKVLSQHGGSIKNMGEQEKKDFFNRIDKSWNSKGEKRGITKEKVLPQKSRPVFGKKLTEGIWTPEQEKSIEILDKVFTDLLTKKGVERYSQEASKLWKSAGFANRQRKIFGKKLTEGKFKKDDVVYHTQHNTIGIVRDVFKDGGDLRTDADGVVNISDIEHYNPMKYKNQKKAKVAPFTKKEIDKRSLWTPFAQRESIIEARPVKGKKSFYTMNNVGSSKYTISDYDGKDTHKDGSPFYGIYQFSNKKKYEAKKKELKSQGYIEESVNESFDKLQYNSHKNHNPYADIIEGHKGNYFITYGIYIKDSGKTSKKGDEFMEFYTGDNYGKSGKSYSRFFTPEKIPGKYKKDWLELKNIYKKKYS